MYHTKLVLSLFLALCVNGVHIVQKSFRLCQASSSRESIGNRARSYIGNQTCHVTGANTSKCNIFVVDVLKEESCPVPNRWFWRYSPIGAEEWADSKSLYLSMSLCWERCNNPEKGNAKATEGHVGIVSGYRNTTSASAAADPQGLIVENDWGFRSGQNPTCWRYLHKRFLC
ncbi:hypothetical protein ACJMK2_010332 [Sinanodonta woodiana]|uniref:Uncharacterized protein n=1 Tax=Sinanodonta woodiana TaxID=1069815 RepID=A0ABD3VF04_SINWO